MALIKCPDCGKEFSDKASACPNCACPVSKEMEKVVREEKKEYVSPNPIAITGFTLSLISVFLPIFWGTIGISGTIFSIIGVLVTFIKNKKGKVLSIIGIILGLIGIASVIFGFSIWGVKFKNY